MPKVKVCVEESYVAELKTVVKPVVVSVVPDVVPTPTLPLGVKECECLLSVIVIEGFVTDAVVTVALLVEGAVDSQLMVVPAVDPPEVTLVPEKAADVTLSYLCACLLSVTP